MAFNTKLRLYDAKFWQDSNDTLGLSGTTSVGKIKYLETFVPSSPLDIPTAAWVTGQTGALSANNGLTRAGDYISLGGALTGNTDITGAFALGLCTTTVNINPTGAVTLNAGTTVGICPTGAITINGGSTVGICPSGAITIQGSAINANTVINYNNEKVYTALSLPTAGWVTGKTSTSGIQTASNGLCKVGTDVKLGGTLTATTTFTSAGGTELLQYGGCYHTNYGPRTIPDVDFVTGQTSTSGIQTANNGLTKVGTNAVLGGALTGVTDISMAGTTCLTFTDTRATKKGVEYADNYSADFALNSLSDYRSVVTATPTTKTENFTLSLDELGKSVIASKATELEITIPNDLAVDFPIGSIITVQQGGVGAVTAVASTGVTVGGVSLSTTQQYGFVQYWKTAANTWSVIGGAIELWQVTGSTVLVPVNTSQKVPVAYIDGITPIFATTITGATNGLCKVGQNVKLGGALSELTTISGAQTLCLSSLTAFNATASNIALTGPVCVTGALNTSTNACVGGTFTLPTVASGSVSNPIMVLDAGVVKCVAASSFNITAVNGLTATGNEVKLGGELTGDTIISSSTHDSCLDITAPMKADDVHYFTFHNDPPQSGHTCGRLYYQDNTLNLDREYTGVTLQIGEESVMKVKNNTGNPILNGDVVYISGSDGTIPEITKAIASDMVNSQNVIGVVTADIADTGQGYVTLHGAVRSLNTVGLSGAEGSTVYLSATVAGAITSTPPVYPNEIIHVGYLIVKDSTNGQVQVAVDVETPYTSIATFTGYTATTKQTLDSKLPTATFTGYTATTNATLTGLTAISNVAITGVTNGLTKVGSHSAKLGGALTESTRICSGAADRSLTLGKLSCIQLVSSGTSGNILLEAQGNSASAIKSTSLVGVPGTNMTSSVGIVFDFDATNNQMVVTDNSSSCRGLQ